MGSPTGKGKDTKPKVTRGPKRSRRAASPSSQDNLASFVRYQTYGPMPAADRAAMTGVKLREIFEEHRVVQGNQKLPSAAAFDALAQVVSMARHMFEVYRPRLLRHQVEAYAARAAD